MKKEIRASLVELEHSLYPFIEKLDEMHNAFREANNRNIFMQMESILNNIRDLQSMTSEIIPYFEKNIPFPFEG